ncbi:MAG: PorP/SprF family type IX secretion system membrane protein [Bacteroidaceae bacterium]|nr:PorP/SprF family type IX secretion system membrane protein [Bacteroidaceae bacterium]
MKKKWLFIILLMVCITGKVQAQFDTHFTHYWEMKNFYNPAGAGAERKLTAYAAYAHQLSGFENNPKTMLINVDAPIPFIKSDHSLGLGVVNDEIGRFTNQHLYLNYAYAFKLLKGRFAVGAQIGLVNCTFENKDLIFGGENNDPAFPSGNADGNSIDFGAGILYQHKYFYAGISGIHLNAPTVLLGEKNEMKVDPYLNFMAGGNIPVKNSLVSIQPSLQVMTDFTAWRADITALGTYNYGGKEFFGGITYSPTVSVAFILGVEMMNITVSYAYELFTSSIGAENGSHDIYIGYKIDLDIFKKGKNKHNSIRILQ